MAGNLTDYAENALLNHILGKTAYTMPTTTYLALFTTAPSDSAAGTEVSTSSTGYARQAITSVMSAASGGASANASTITFGAATASWGTVMAFGIFDAATGGNMLLYGTLSASKAIASGDRLEFAASQLSASLD